MMLVRSALPQRSPMPLMVPCTWRAPCRTAARLLAAARSESLWQWMPSRTLGKRARTVETASAMNSGKLPPLVSHRARQEAPAWAAAESVSRANSGLAL